MVATLTRTLGSRHLTLAEDAVQDALMTAMQQWPFRGIPDNPKRGCSRSRATARSIGCATAGWPPTRSRRSRANRRAFESPAARAAAAR